MSTNSQNSHKNRTSVRLPSLSRTTTQTLAPQPHYDPTFITATGQTLFVSQSVPGTSVSDAEVEILQLRESIAAADAALAVARATAATHAAALDAREASICAARAAFDRRAAGLRAHGDAASTRAAAQRAAAAADAAAGERFDLACEDARAEIARLLADADDLRAKVKSHASTEELLDLAAALMGCSEGADLMPRIEQLDRAAKQLDETLQETNKEIADMKDELADVLARHSADVASQHVAAAAATAEAAAAAAAVAAARAASEQAVRSATTSTAELGRVWVALEAMAAGLQRAGLAGRNTRGPLAAVAEHAPGTLVDVVTWLAGELDIAKAVAAGCAVQQRGGSHAEVAKATKLTDTAYRGYMAMLRLDELANNK